MSTRDVIDRSSRFFIQVPNDLVREIKNANAFLVYSILKTYTNGSSNTVFPGRETIAATMGAKTTKPVDTALKELRRLGLVATFPRWLGDDGSISRVKDEAHSRQTSNGYILYDTINLSPPEGWDDPNTQPPKRGGVGSQKGTPPGGQTDTPRVAEKVHEVYPPEVHPSEVEKPPVVPQGGPAGKSEESGSSKTSTRGTRIPENFFPSEQAIRTVRRTFPGMQPAFMDYEHQKFVDHFTAASGPRGVKKDWDATWRNWMRTAVDRLPTSQKSAMFGQGPTPQPTVQHPSKADQYRDLGAEIAHEFASGGDQ
ncbi:helix-turn-helix domain-containing protein [Corynebacterium sp. YIM 101645]|uniref:Helix-turn-helix domain-containing protein n=1 Tax=Corynebacterium lemuris TaxID=1859292 RepID=A0ABT2FX25_9CORY|nr:helix-turn-helix domain-containing protein [Corynebacterium lemuris]MCS5479792.1 helix-turn-helix domain-containing protein [Corynebacterium lemuris]